MSLLSLASKAGLASRSVAFNQGARQSTSLRSTWRTRRIVVITSRRVRQSSSCLSKLRPTRLIEGASASPQVDLLLGPPARDRYARPAVRP